MRKLLIITALYTGHGHKSISDALEERLAAYPDLETLSIDGFDLMSKFQQVCAEKTYGPITRLPGKAWQLNYAAGMKLQTPVRIAIASMIRHHLEELILDFRPDCILTVHPVFIGSVIDVVEGMGLNIPVIAHEADLIDIANFWFDKRISLVLAPSKESYDCTVEHGVDPKRVRQVGFPVRKRFMDLRGVEKPKHEGVNITIMSGSEGSGLISTVTHQLLRGTDAHINVICGRNKALRQKIRKAYGKRYFGRIRVLGFVENIQDIMMDSDVLIMRASPNSVLEAVALNIPVILFGQLAGQELHNPQLMEAHGIAAYCPEPDKLPAKIQTLFADNGALAKKMQACQRAYMPGDAAADTARLLDEVVVAYDWPKP